MDIQNLPHLLQERFRELPPLAQEMFVALEYLSVFAMLQKNFGVSPEQLAVIDEELLLVLFGLEDPEHLAEHITQESGLDQSVAQEIANILFTEVMGPFSKKLATFVEATRMDGTAVDLSKNVAASSAPLPQIPHTHDRTLPELLVARSSESSKNGNVAVSVPSQTGDSSSTPQSTPPTPTYQGVDPYREEPQ